MEEKEDRAPDIQTAESLANFLPRDGEKTKVVLMPFCLLLASVHSENINFTTILILFSFLAFLLIISFLLCICIIRKSCEGHMRILYQDNYAHSGGYTAIA